MAPPPFPQLAGQGWSVHKKPVFSTLVASHVSGREVRDALYQNPIWEFELVFDGLDSSAAGYPGLGAYSLQSLMGLFLQCQGRLGTFLYADPTDNSVTQQRIGIGDGTTTSFTLTRTLGGFTEPLSWVTGVTPYLNGVLQTSGFQLNAPNVLTFASPPGSGADIKASCSYAFQCRFDDDAADFEQFMQNLWKVDSLKFRSVRAQ